LTLQNCSNPPCNTQLYSKKNCPCCGYWWWFFSIVVIHKQCTSSCTHALSKWICCQVATGYKFFDNGYLGQHTWVPSIAQWHVFVLFLWPCCPVCYCTKWFGCKISDERVGLCWKIAGQFGLYSNIRAYCFDLWHISNTHESLRPFSSMLLCGVLHVHLCVCMSMSLCVFLCMYISLHVVTVSSSFYISGFVLIFIIDLFSAHRHPAQKPSKIRFLFWVFYTKWNISRHQSIWFLFVYKISGWNVGERCGHWLHDDIYAWKDAQKGSLSVVVISLS